MSRYGLRTLLIGLLAAVIAAGLLSASGQATAQQRNTLPDGAFLSAMTGGNTGPTAIIRESEPRSDGFRHVDTPAMIERLRQMHATTFTYGVWDKATDWSDLTDEFAPAAEAAGIDIMVYLVPPSECFPNPVRHLDGRCSRPFEMDYVRWAQEIANLSVAHPNVKSWGIDDFLVGKNAELFTKEYLGQVRAAQDAINPALKWYVTMYFGDITPEHIANITGILDGVIYPYLGQANNTVDATWLEQRLDAAGAVTSAAGLELVLLLYTGRFLDGIINPTEGYVADALTRAEPYLADGRITGIIAYGAPVDVLNQQPSWDYWGHSGMGRLSLSVSNFVSTVDGAFASATQTVDVDPNAAAKTLTFQLRDQYEEGLTDYQFTQVLVDGAVAWQTDVVAGDGETWEQQTVDLTQALAGKTSAELTFRLYHQKGVGWWPTDVGIDDVAGTGLTVRNGDFEKDADWRLDRSDGTMQPLIDIYHPDRPARIVNAIGTGYARIQGEEFTPVQGGEWPSLRIGPDNRAMHGNGRLLFRTPDSTPIPANTCASASQDVAVLPSPRYEVNFWHGDRYQAAFDKGFKQFAVDGQVLWDRDAGDYWPWFMIEGSDHQGSIDITDFVAGKEKVRLEFRFCTKNPVDALEIDFGVDTLRTVGLDLVNGEFESAEGWTLQSNGPITASIDVHGPCQDPNARVLTGRHDGPLTVTGVTCLRDATITGPVTVRRGGALYAEGGTIDGGVTADGADSVTMTGTTVHGTVAITGTTETAIDHATVDGSLRLGDGRARVAGTTVQGGLTCTGAAPVEDGVPNRVGGKVSC
jgi:hypothetical protein